ncbi:hypothetical protein D9M69_604780 [compost metagenome]
MHQHRFAKGRTAARTAVAVDRRLHRHEGQWHKLGDASGGLLQVTDVQQMPSGMDQMLDVPEHDGRGSAKAYVVRGGDRVEPLLRAQFVRTDDGAH